jgi:hypothetical protein
MDKEIKVKFPQQTMPHHHAIIDNTSIRDHWIRIEELDAAKVDILKQYHSAQDDSQSQ